MANSMLAEASATPDLAPRAATRRAIAYPPAGLGAEAAAQYVALGVTTFLALVADKKAPAAILPTPGRRIWRRVDLDAWLESLPNEAENIEAVELSEGVALCDALFKNPVKAQSSRA